MTADPIEARAQQLLRWYPRRWREQYGEEFAELLVAELDEAPDCWRRTADVARGGIVVRLSVLGLAGSPVGGPQAAVGAAAAALVAFLACGLSLWSQLIIGWHWSRLDAHDLRFGVLTMSAVGVFLTGLALLAVVPVVAGVVRRLGQREPGDVRRIVLPLAVVLLGVAFLVTGGHALQHAWPGAGGHSTHLRRLVPTGAAGFGWAETLAITAYWVHPSQLVALPHAQFAWILTSPVVLVATVIAAVTVVRRVPLAASTLRYEARLAQVAAAGMGLFLLAAAWWVIASRSGSSTVFRAGTLDLFLIAAMSAALTVAATASRQITRQER
jgi:hypothetical protein